MSAAAGSAARTVPGQGAGLARRAALSALLVLLPAAGIAAEGVVAALHADPPAPCVAKAEDDRSSLIAIKPRGETDAQVRGIMGGLASMFLAEGGERLAPENTDTVYTAVFHAGDPVDEVGIYAYRFTAPVESRAFAAREGLNGSFRVVGERLLVLLWREPNVRTEACYAALDQALSAAAR